MVWNTQRRWQLAEDDPFHKRIVWPGFFNNSALSQCDIPDLHTQHHENLKSHLTKLFRMENNVGKGLLHYTESLAKLVNTSVA
jgi:hypothetical protein